MNRTKVFLVLAAANALLSALAWAVVTGHLAAPRGFIEVVPMVVSIPGWSVAIGIWGFNSGESALSDAVIIVTNTVVHSIAEILLLRAGQAIVVSLSKRGTGA